MALPAAERATNNSIYSNSGRTSVESRPRRTQSRLRKSRGRACSASKGSRQGSVPMVTVAESPLRDERAGRWAPRLVAPRARHENCCRRRGLRYYFYWPSRATAGLRGSWFCAEAPGGESSDMCSDFSSFCSPACLIRPPAGWGRARSKRKGAAAWHVDAPRGSNREEAIRLSAYFVPISWESIRCYSPSISFGFPSIPVESNRDPACGQCGGIVWNKRTSSCVDLILCFRLVFNSIGLFRGRNGQETRWVFFKYIVESSAPVNSLTTRNICSRNPPFLSLA